MTSNRRFRLVIGALSMLAVVMQLSAPAAALHHEGTHSTVELATLDAPPLASLRSAAANEREEASCFGCELGARAKQLSRAPGIDLELPSPAISCARPADQGTLHRHDQRTLGARAPPALS
jgi:hypothetical protein